jgi:hypothetical protein
VPNNAFVVASTTHLGLVSNQDACQLVYIFKDHKIGLNAASFQNLLCALHIRLPMKTGGASRDRTDDPLLAKQVLSQLSYGPVMPGQHPSNGGSRWTRTTGLTLIRGAL